MKWVKYLYIFLLLYILAAIIFWGSTLQQMNNKLFETEMQLLNEQKSHLTPEITNKKNEELLDKKESRNRQYIGEGATFLIFILIGAALVYSSLKRVNKLSTLQNNFMLSVTHELKSPIAGVKLNIQTLQRKNLPEDKKDILITRALNEANRLNELCNNLLLASKMEGNKVNVNLEQFSLSNLCNQVMEEFESRSHHTLIKNIDKDCIILGDEILIKMAVSNLVENAIKYSPADTSIELRLENLPQQYLLSVKDEGDGIAEDEKQKIFDKFYRIGEENSRKAKGTGLGLYLTSEILKLHKANIVVSNNEPKGTIFELTFDKANA